MKQVYAFVMLFFALTELVSAKEKINVLLLSGQNNHKWEETTPALQNILEKSMLFNVTITEEPQNLSTQVLSSYDLILSNWNQFPEMDCNWTEDTKSAFMDFVKEGGGVLFVHAATSVHNDWQSFQHLAGATWCNETRHGHKAPYELIIKDRTHPITRGLSNFWIRDELWVNIQDYGTSNVLAEGFAPKSNKGRDKMEPVLFEQKLGKGRSVFLVPGHDKKTMQNLGFQTLLLRSAEWAATGKVKQRVPQAIASTQKMTDQKFKWKESKTSLELTNNKEVILKLNFDKKEGKPYFHPLKTTKGTNLSWLRPEDHPWHRSIWFSWKFINGLNYWEEDRVTGLSEGVTELLTVENKITKNYAISSMKLSYHPPQQKEILSELREIRISLPDKNGNYYIDWHSSFTAITDEVILDRTPLIHEVNGKKYGGYTGFSARFDKDLWDLKPFNDKGKSEDLHGNSSKWITYQFKDLKGEYVSVSIFDHPDNINHPNRWYIETSDGHPFYFFSPCPLFGSQLKLKKGEKLDLKYRMLISPNKLNINLIQENWSNYKNRYHD